MTRAQLTWLIAGFILLAGIIVIVSLGVFKNPYTVDAYFKNNMVDIFFWLVTIFITIKYAIIRWKKDDPMIYMILVSFYGIFLIYRLGTFQLVIARLIDLCIMNGVDVSDFL